MDSQIATIGDVKTYLGLKQSDADRDELLQRLLNGASLMVERYTGLRFEPNPAFVANVDSAAPVTLPSIRVPESTTLPRFSSDNPFSSQAISPTFPAAPVVVTIPHARAITAVTINDGRTNVALASTSPPGAGYWTENDSRLYTPYIRRIGIVSPAFTPVYNVQVTGKFGIVPAPDDIVDAVIAITARRYKEKDAAYSDVVQLQDGSVANYFRQFPASVKAIVDSYTEVGV